MTLQQLQEEKPDFNIRFRLSAGNALMKDLRAKKGLLQEDVAKALGVKKTKIGHIEQCRVYPDIELGSKIADFLGSNFDTLFPSWLQAFTAKWEKANKVADIPVETVALSSPGVLSLPAETNIESKIDNDIKAKALEKIIDQLPARIRKILRFRYGYEDGGPRTLEECGYEFDVTRERIRQMEAKGLEMLRDKIAEGEAKELTPV